MTSNKFGRFFYSPSYIKMKNLLFNYQFRKWIISKYFFNYFNKSNNFKKLKIIDIGSGISPVTPIPSQTIFVDLEKEAVDIMKKKGFNSIIGDITKIPLEKNQYDLVLCSEVLEHVPDYKKALKEIFRVAKNKGIAIITVPTHERYWNSDDDFVGHLRRFNPDILEKEIEESGLKVIINKPIGSRVERLLTIALVKAAKGKTSKPMEAGKFKLALFGIVNSILFNVVKLFYYLNTKKSSSISLFVAVKDYSS